MSDLQESDVNLMESPHDKVVLVGDVGVGKTTLFMRFRTGQFVENTTHNPREGEYHKSWTVQGGEVSVSTLVVSRARGMLLRERWAWSLMLICDSSQL